MVEIQSVPPAPIRYSTDGSDPKSSGGVYEQPFVVPSGTVYVLAVAEKRSIVSEEHRRKIEWDKKAETFEIDPIKPATWQHRFQPITTKESFEFLARLQKYQAQVVGPRIGIHNNQQWLELSGDAALILDASQIESSIAHLRSLQPDGQIQIEADALRFPTGQLLSDWSADAKIEAIEPEEVKQ
jgi:Fn3 associated